MRVAAFQRRPTEVTREAFASVADDLAWADRSGVDLAVFPECHLVGHAYDEATIGRRARACDSPDVAELLSRLASVRATAVLGLFERRGAATFNTALVVARGEIVGRYSKAHPNEYGVEAGSSFPVFATELPFGINICNDANYPATAQRLAEAGARVICYPLCNVLRPEVAEVWRTRSVDNLRERALDTGCWVVSSDVTGAQGSRLSYGCTVVVRPDGEIVARAPEMAEGVILHDLY